MSWAARVAGLLPRSWLKAVGRAQWRHPLLKRAFDWTAGRLRRGDQVIRQGVGRGLGFNASGSNAGYVLGTSEPHVQQALELLISPGMTVHDVGANVGFLTVIAARLVSETGTVVCFEPLEENRERIKHNVALNDFSNVQMRCEALGAEDGTARFLLSEMSSWGRLASAGEVSQQVGEISVPLLRLDAAIAEGVARPDLMKIDVEGAECDVLAGGREVLRARHPILLIELHGTNAAVADTLEALGYSTVVVGRTLGVREAPWNAHVVAFAPNDARVAALVPQLTSLELSG